MAGLNRGARRAMSRMSALASHPSAHTLQLALPYIAVVLLWMAVDVIPAVSNDGTVYLEHSDSLKTSGLIDRGWRMVGYPVFLRLSRTLGPLVGLDGLFTVVIIQRFLALVFGVILARAYRWWGVAFFGFLFSIRMMVYLDYLLAESIAIPLAALAGLAFGLYWVGSVRLLVAGPVVLCIVVYLSTVRLHYLTLWVAPLLMLASIILTKNRSALRRFGAATAIGLAVVSMFYLGVGSENLVEHQVWAPVVDDGNLAYYSLWSTLFVVEALEPSGRELTAFYDEGSPWPVIRELRAVASVSERRDRYGELIASLIDVSGSSKTELRLRAFAGALLAGRYDDMVSIKQRVTSGDLRDRLSSTFQSANVQRMGEQQFLDVFNRGRPPESLITSSLSGFVPKIPLLAVGALWLLLMIVSLVPRMSIRWQYPYVLSAAAPHIVVSAAAAYISGDSTRWLLPTLTFSTVAQFVAAMTRVPHRSKQWPR